MIDDGDYRYYDEDGYNSEEWVGRKDNYNEEDNNQDDIQGDNHWQHQSLGARFNAHEQIPPRFKASTTVKNTSVVHSHGALS